MPVPAAVQGRRNGAADWAVPTMVWRLVSKVRVSAGLVSSLARPPAAWTQPPPACVLTWSSQSPSSKDIRTSAILDQGPPTPPQFTLISSEYSHILGTGGDGSTYRFWEGHSSAQSSASLRAKGFSLCLAVITLLCVPEAVARVCEVR